MNAPRPWHWFPCEMRDDENARECYCGAAERLQVVLSALLGRVERGQWSKHANPAEAKMRQALIDQARNAL